MNKIPTDKHVWMEVGHFSNNTQRFIDITAIYKNLGPNICNALPGFHAFTGCDYTASFFGKWKIKPFDILTKHTEICEAFAKLGQSDVIPNDVMVQIERFVCHMYQHPKFDNINKVRLSTFIKIYENKSTNNPLHIKKAFNTNLFPPCHAVLTNKIKRTNQISAIWKYATEREPAFYDPVNSGWSLCDNKFRIVWFEGLQMPESINDIITRSFSR